VGSLGIGIFFGLLASYLLKKMRFLTVQSIRETLFIFSFGYLSYTAGELLKMSGIISLLTSGIVMAHYAWYNLSPQGKHVSGIAFSVIGYGFEAFIFAYLGLTFFSYADLKSNVWSWSFILVELANVIISRFLGTVCLLYFVKLCGHKT
jgi:solute carrier family 9 (sodium/hydrogen exchanger), member 6/7